MNKCLRYRPNIICKNRKINIKNLNINVKKVKKNSEKKKNNKRDINKKTKII